VESISQLRAALAASPATIDLFLPSGSSWFLDGAPLPIGERCNVTIRSEGSGALLDAAQRSRILEVERSAWLRLEMITLANGLSPLAAGGATLISSGAEVEMLSCNLSSNVAAHGGAAAIIDAQLVLHNTTVTANSAHLDGGAFFVSTAGRLVLRLSTVVGSFAQRFGGALFVTSGCTLLAEFTSFVDSVTIQRGGGLYLLYSHGKFAHCEVLRSHSQSSGGAFHLRGGSLTVMHSSIKSSRSDSAAAAMWVEDTAVLVSNCSIVDSSAMAAGGFYIGGSYMSAIDSNVTLICSLIENSHTFDGSAGVVHLNAGLFLMLWSSVVESSATRNGGVAYLQGGALHLVNSNATASSALENGGAVYQSSGSTLMTGSLISNVSAQKCGGAMWVGNGDLTVTDASTIANSIAPKSHGGAFYLSGGSLRVLMGSLIANATCKTSGGMLRIYSGTFEVAGGVMIVNSKTTSGWGGCLRIDGGSVSVSNSSLVDQTAASVGGAVAISGGVLTVSKSLIARSRSNDRTRAGGFLFLRGGEVHLDYSVVEDSVSTHEVAHILRAYPASGSTPLLLVTFSEFRQHACDGAIFNPWGPGAQIVLRAASFTPLAGCNASSLASPNAFPGITTKSCTDATYVDQLSMAQPLCSSATPGSCSPHVIDGTPLQGVSCVCPDPEFSDPLAADIRYAPYGDPGGCINPRRLVDVTVMSREVGGRELRTRDGVRFARSLSAERPCLPLVPGISRAAQASVQ
jgi:hypothetical protein